MATKEITIKIPQSWADIKLKDYLALMKELKNYEGEEEAQTAIMITYLCGLDPMYLSQLTKEAFDTIKDDLSAFINNTNLPLQKIIQINGIEYGFEPNLSQMSYGAFVDISKYDTISVDENWAKVMSILYRPVTNKILGTYEIETYKGVIDDKAFLELGMDIHFGCFFLFTNLLKDLTLSILSSTKVTANPHNTQLILEKSGEIMRRLWN